MEISQFLALSCEERLKFAPVIAKYNPTTTSAIKTLIDIINRVGFDTLLPCFKRGFLLNLSNVPNSELNN